MKNLEQVLKEGNSTENQNIKGKFITQHINVNVGSMVEFILRSEGENKPFDYEDIENLFEYPELNEFNEIFYGGSEEDKEERLKEIQEQIDEIESRDEEGETEEQIERLENFKSELENLESEPQEIYEWWSVSDFLARKLKELNHPIIKSENIWGRCTSGQAILLDYAITVICANMEILDGQKYAW